LRRRLDIFDRFDTLDSGSALALAAIESGGVAAVAAISAGRFCWQSLKGFPSVMAAMAAVADPLRRHKLVVLDVVVGYFF